MDIDLQPWKKCRSALSNEVSAERLEKLSRKNSPFGKSPKVYSKKIFLGGLPPDIDDVGILNTFATFKPIHVDWPGKTRNVHYMFPPKGFAFLYFACEESVHLLMKSCWQDGEHYYFPVSSPSTKKLTQVRPWRIEDSEVIIDPRIYNIPQYPVFVGGIPRPMTSVELATVVMKRFGNVGYAGIFLDTQTHYPRGSGVILFTNFDSYCAAINQHYVLVDEKLRCIELKPYSFSNSAGHGGARLHQIDRLSGDIGMETEFHL